MSWLSFFRKGKQETAPDESEFYSHAEEIPVARRGRGRGKAADEAADPMLPEKKRARRRLVGAVAIALTLAIVLPIVLDSEPKPATGDITIHIPSRDKASKMVAARPSSAPSAAQEPTSAAGASATQESAPAPVLPAAPAASVAPPAPATTPASVSSKASAAVASKPAPAKSADEDAIGKLVKAADAKQAKFMIQVAALASQDKVKELRGKLEKAGYKTATQIVPTKDGDRIRIRVGPYASKEDAEKACPKLNTMNLKCTILSI